ncbi:MAG: hypothetical protein LBJ00_00595 [Planctomycetaceae bacterium]|nr:hypothetical protein [Planctomycetaceae bacterium]
MGNFEQIEYIFICELLVIPKPVWATGFVPEQPLHVVALARSATGISKQLKHIIGSGVRSFHIYLNFL